MNTIKWFELVNLLAPMLENKNKYTFDKYPSNKTYSLALTVNIDMYVIEQSNT